VKEHKGRVRRDFRLELKSPIYGPARDCELTIDLGKMQVYRPRAYQIEPGDL
jgi:hypothetical protein